MTPATTRRRPGFDWLSWSLLAVMVAASALAWDRVPPELPIHWDLEGRPDGTANRDVALALLPLTGGLLMGVFWLLARGLPVRESALVTRGVQLTSRGVLGLLTLLHLSIILSALGQAISVPRVALGGAALLLMLIGFVLRSLPPNRLIGIRVPATLADRDIWRRVHRAASVLFIVLGICVLAASILSVGVQLGVLMGGLTLAVVLSVIYATRLRDGEPVEETPATRRQSEVHLSDRAAPDDDDRPDATR